MRGAHVEHVAHVRDARRVPAGNVRVKVLQVTEEPAHVGDARDIQGANNSNTVIFIYNSMIYETRRRKKNNTKKQRSKRKTKKNKARAKLPRDTNHPLVRLAC